MTIPAADGARICCRIDEPVERAGAAPAVVLINSLGTNLHMWEPQVGSLARSFRVVRYDCRGHGESEVTPGPYSIDLLGRDLVSVLDALSLERVYLCGLSLGGMVALWAAAHHRGRVDAMVLANTGARIGTRESWDARISAVNAGGMAAVRDAALARFLGSEYRQRRPEVAATISGMLRDTDPSGYTACCAALRDADLHAVLPRIRIPCLVIGADRDESTPRALAEELHAGIAGSRLVILPSAHLSNVEQDERFTAEVSGFLPRQGA